VIERIVQRRRIPVIMDAAAAVAATVAPHRQPREGDGDEDESVSNDDDDSVATNAHRT